MGNYNIQKQVALQKLAVTVEGSFQPLDAQNFLDAFNKEIKMITSSQYELAFECSKLNVSSQQMIPVLQGCMELYKKIGFKKISINTGGNVILKMQMQKIITAVNLTNTTLI